MELSTPHKHPAKPPLPPQPADHTAAPAVATDAVSRNFAAGNYAQVALDGDTNRWETHAALGLMGKTPEALAGLARFDGQQARFFEAVTHWIDGNDVAAAAGLARIPTEHARNLLALIRKPKIRVLGQLPWTRTGPSDFLSWLSADPKFEVQNISFTSQDLGNEPYADLERSGLLETPPDFYLCKMVEWHLVPPSIQQLPCPIIGATADYDLHIQAVFPWLQLFDQMVVTDQTEWQDVQRLVDVPVSTFPKSFGLSPGLPPIKFSDRPIDVYLSGSVLHPFHLDKMAPLQEALRLPAEHKVVICEGFTPQGHYHTLLNCARATVTYIRHGGAMTTRGLEALAMGCAPVVQRGSSLSIFYGEEHGVLTYEPTAGHCRQQLRRVIEEWPEFAGRCTRGAKRVRQDFSLPRVTSQYLRFVSYLAAAPRRPRQQMPTERLDQKRSILAKGWLPGPPGVVRCISTANHHRWSQRLQQGATVEDSIDAARELVLAFASALPIVEQRLPLTLEVFDDAPRLPLRPLDHAMELYAEGCACFPGSLVLRFNHLRTALHYGRPDEVDGALELARETLAVPPQDWQVGLAEDVFPWDFFSAMFNYRAYFDLVTSSHARGDDNSTQRAQLIQASIHHYLSHYERHEPHARAAVQLDPDFPFYRFRCGGIIRELRPEAAGQAEAAEMLLGAGDQLLYSPDALLLLRQLHAAGVDRAAPYQQQYGSLERFLEGQKMLQQMGIAGQDNAQWRFSILQPPGTPSLKEEEIHVSQH